MSDFNSRNVDTVRHARNSGDGMANQPEILVGSSGRNRAPTKLGAARQTLRAFLHQPYLTVNTVLTTIAGGATASVLLVGGIGNHFQRVASGDAEALMLSTTSITALLCGTIGMGLLADKRHNETRERKVAKNDKDNLRLQQNLDALLRDSVSMQDELSDIIKLIALRSEDSWYRRKNDIPAWAGVAPNSVFISIDGKCASEVLSRPDAYGGASLRADKTIIKTVWMPRFATYTRLEKVIHIVRADPNSSKPSSELSKLLGAYRVLRDLAVEANLHIDLRSVELVMIDERLWSHGSVFIGEKSASGIRSEPHSFVQRYHSIPLPSADPINATVEVNFSEELVSHYRSVVNELMESSLRILNLEEAEEQFGGEVQPLSNGTNRPIMFGSLPPRSDSFDGGDGNFVI